MIAITVVLVGVIGGFILGVGDQPEQSPQARLSFEYNTDSGTVEVVHQGGQQIEATAVAVQETGSSDGIALTKTTGSFRSGDVIADGTYESGETIRVIWRDSEGKRSDVVGESTAP